MSVHPWKVVEDGLDRERMRLRKPRLSCLYQDQVQYIWKRSPQAEHRIFLSI